jgi:ribose/xylose/arabinose/galactoside ABC-type transport system permease subunit
MWKHVSDDGRGDRRVARDQLQLSGSADEAGTTDRLAPLRELTDQLLPRPAPHRRHRLPEELGVIVALAVLIGFIGAARPRFLDPNNLLNLSASSAFVGILALGMVFLLAMREIDLSIGWMFNFSAVVAALAMRNGMNPFLAAGVGIAFGAMLGLVNGLLAVSLRLPVLIITLGTLSMYQGLSLVVNDSRAVVPPPEVRDSAYFNLLTADLPGGVPAVTVVFVVLAAVLHVVLHRTRFGYRTLAIGSNPEAARLAGVPLGRTRIQVLVLMGAVAGLSGVLFVGFRGAVDPNSGGDFLLPVIAAVIIGGTPLAGGAGTIFGTLIGVLIIAVIGSGVIFLGIDAVWSTFVTGLVIVVAVGVDQLVRQQRKSEGGRSQDAI